MEFWILAKKKLNRFTAKKKKKHAQTNRKLKIKSIDSKPKMYRLKMLTLIKINNPIEINASRARVYTHSLAPQASLGRK